MISCFGRHVRTGVQGPKPLDSASAECIPRNKALHYCMGAAVREVPAIYPALTPGGSVGGIRINLPTRGHVPL